MPRGTKLLEINYCGECKHTVMCVSAKEPYPYCDGVMPNKRFIEDGVDARDKGIPSWCPLPDKG